jgi:hypothetical protein
MKNPFYNDEQDTHLRLIPQIEKVPVIVRFAQTYPGKFCIGLIHCLILASINWRWSWLVAAATALLVFPERWKALRLFISLAGLEIFYRTRLFGFAIESDAEMASYDSVLRPIHQRIDSFLPAYQAFGLAAGFAFFWLFFRYVHLRRPKHPLLLLTAISAVFVGTALLTPIQSTTYLSLWGIALIVCRNFIAAGYTLLSQPKDQEPQPIPSLLVALQCSLVNVKRPVLRSVDLLTQPDDRAATAVCRLKAIKLFFSCRIILFFRDLVRYVVYGQTIYPQLNWIRIKSLKWPNYRVIGFSDYNALHIPALHSWMLVLINGFLFICSLSVITDTMISVIRLAGIYTPRFICRPYLATTFNEYYRRVQFYYSEIIIHFFYYPAWGAIRGLREHRMLRSCLALFYAVALGGWLIHIQSGALDFLSIGPGIAFHLYLSWLPYFIGVGTVCCISATGYFSKGYFEKIPRFAKFTLIYWMHSVLLAMINSHCLDTWASRVTFFRSLFGVSGL